MTLRLCSDPTVAVGPVDDAPIVYADEDLARLLAEVERRSDRRRRHQQRAVQTAACVVVAVVAWLSFLPAASGEAPVGHHPVASTTANVGRAAPSGV
jgi:hypothetical protein